MKTPVLLALLIGSCGVAQAADAQKVLDCVRANVPSSLRVQEVELSSTDRSNAVRTLRGRVYALRQPDGKLSRVRVMLRVKAPDNLAGSAFLVREAAQLSDQGMYVYLPSVRRVRRITGEFADGALLGSDFSYQDFKQLQNGFQDLSSTLEAPESLDSRPVDVLTSVPLPGSPSSYSQIRSWIDQKTCVPLKVEFYRNNSLLKVMTIPAAAIQSSAGHWYPAEANIRDVKAGTSSQLKVIGVDNAAKLSRGTFDPQLFYRIGG